MIFLPVLFVLAAAPVGRVHEVLAERLEAREQGEAVGLQLGRMGFAEVRLWRQTWVVARGVLSAEGAELLGVAGSAGKVVVLATQSVPGGWTMGLLKVEGELLRFYVQGPGRVPEGKAVPVSFAFDGGLFFSDRGTGLADGTVQLPLPQTPGRRGVYRFGPRQVVFLTEGLHQLAERVNGLGFPEGAVERVEEVAAAGAGDGAGDGAGAGKVVEAPPALRIK